VEYCVALANEGGGKIVFGVTDRRPRRIVGTAAFAEPGRTEAGLHDRLSHRIPVAEVRTADGRVLIVHVPPRLPGTAWQIDGRYLKRAGDELTGLSDAELKAMFAETGPTSRRRFVKAQGSATCRRKQSRRFGADGPRRRATSARRDGPTSKRSPMLNCCWRGASATRH
jgi:predicted HTH transcriptional regulator